MSSQENGLQIAGQNRNISTIALPISIHEAQSNQEHFLATVQEMNKLLGVAIAAVSTNMSYPHIAESNPNLQDQQDITEIEGYFSEYLSKAKHVELFFRQVQMQVGVTPRQDIEEEIKELEAELQTKTTLMEKHSRILSQHELRFQALKERLEGALDEQLLRCDS